VPRLLPGEQVTFERAHQSVNGGPSSDDVTRSDPTTVNAFLTFRDTAGVRWTVREDGTLSDLAPASPHG
jgi:hypothetical protein